MSGADEATVSRRWLAAASCVVLVLASLVVVGYAWSRSGEANPVDAAQTLRADADDPAATRAALRELAEEFVVEFHTYGPDDLVDGELVGYRDRVSGLMTAKFESVFAQQIALPAATVAKVKNQSSAEAQASGVVTADDDSAEVLVGGVITTSYQHPDREKKRIESDPMPVRYRVLMVRVDGEWLVDDLDQLGDDLPGFAEQGAGQSEPSGSPAPTDSATAESTAPVPTPDESPDQSGGEQ